MILCKCRQALFFAVFILFNAVATASESIESPIKLTPSSQIQVLGSYQDGSKLGWLVDPDKANDKTVLVIILTDAENSVRVLPFKLETVNEDPSSGLQTKRGFLVTEDLDPRASLIQRIRYEVEYYVNNVSSRSPGQDSTNITLRQAAENSIDQPQLSWSVIAQNLGKDVVPLSAMLPDDHPSESDLTASIGTQLEALTQINDQNKATKFVLVNRDNQSRTVFFPSTTKIGTFFGGTSRFGNISVLVTASKGKRKGVQKIQLLNTGDHQNAPNLLRATQIISQALNRNTLVSVLQEGQSEDGDTRYTLFSYIERLPLNEDRTSYGLVVNNQRTNLVVPLNKKPGDKFLGVVRYFDPTRGQFIEQQMTLDGFKSLTERISNTVRVSVLDSKTSETRFQTLTFEKPARKTTKTLETFQATPWVSKAFVFCSRFGASLRWQICVPKNALTKRSYRKHNAIALWDSQTGSTQIIDAKLTSETPHLQLGIGYDGGSWFSPFFARNFPVESSLYDLQLTLKPTGDAAISTIELNWQPRQGALFQLIPVPHLINPGFKVPSSVAHPRRYLAKASAPSLRCQQLLPRQ